MAIAYVLIKCDLGCDEQIIKELKPLSEVKEVNGTFGAYDMIVKVESDLFETLKETITWKIRHLDHVRSTMTLMGIDGQE